VVGQGGDRQRGVRDRRTIAQQAPQLAGWLAVGAAWGGMIGIGTEVSSGWPAGTWSRRFAQLGK